MIDRGINQVKLELLNELAHDEIQKALPYLHEFCKVEIPEQ